MRYPEFLEKGGRIGLIAPSFGCAEEPYLTRFAAAEERFRAMGYRLAEGPNCRAAEGIGKSNTPEACAAEISRFFAGDESDVILSCGGGETMCEDLSFVDFEALSRAEPKWFMGYSDNTNLTFLLPTLCDTASVYGPNAPSFGMRTWHPSLADAFRILTGDTEGNGGKDRAAAGNGSGGKNCHENSPRFLFHNYDGWERQGEELPEGAVPDPLSGYNLTEEYRLSVFVPERIPASEGASGRGSFRLVPGERAEISGRLLGGCLDCLQVHCGTKYDRVKEFAETYREDGILWFMEACDLTPMGIRRALWQLAEAGWFAHVKGFILGRAYRYEEEFCGLDRISAATGILAQFGVPVLIDADLGHLPPAMPFITGAYAQVLAENGKLTVEQILK